MTTEDWVILSNVLVAITSILAAASTEHEVVKNMRDTILGVMHSILPTTKRRREDDEKEPRRRGEGRTGPGGHPGP